MQILNPPLNLLRPPKFIVTEEPPSIVEQAKEWGSLSILDFGHGKPPECEYFNASLVALPDRDWLVVRRSKNDPNAWVGINDLMAFALTDWKPQFGAGLICKKFSPQEQMEDPRCVFHNGQIYISNCNFIWYHERSQWTGAHVNLQRFKAGWQNSNDATTWTALSRHDIVYGNNMDRCAATKGFEKNWLPFFYNDALHFVYQASPHIVFRCDKELTKGAETFYSEWDSTSWRWGELRGGTPPIIGPDGQYWTCFHSSQPWRKQKRRYYAGWYSFEPMPPFRVTSISRKPWLIGSTKDGCPEGKLPCVFPAGCLYRDEEFIVSMGVNDLKVGLAKVPFEWVWKSVRELNPKCPEFIPE